MPKLNRLCLLAVLGLGAALHAQDTKPADSTKTIDATDTAAVAAANGSSGTVQGKVEQAEWSKSGKVCTISFENSPGFMAAAFEKKKDKLNAAFGGDFAKQLTGAVIKVSGKIAPYGGKNDAFKDAMQIIIADTSQVTVVTPATQPVADTTAGSAGTPTTAPSN